MASGLVDRHRHQLGNVCMTWGVWEHTAVAAAAACTATRGWRWYVRALHNSQLECCQALGMDC